ncbi:hypothetical protein DL765_000647 [Monosporascus sp. GIB2]|nr:hypothetical protein DL765_000647 [Monosporascus sp. GIB2]
MSKEAGSPATESLASPGSEASQQLPTRKSTYAKVYNFFGFNKAYNFPLWVIFAGAMLGFSLSRLQDFNYDELFAINIAPGYMYYFHAGAYRVGMILHLAGALPASILLVLQFTPVIRRRYITFHRINGYVTLVLFFISNAAACIVLRHNHSGNRIAAQSAEAFLVIATTIGMGLAWWNIRRLQIDQHRAWMLRTMFYMGTIVTSRILTNIASKIVTRMGDYYMVWSCDELDFLYKEYGLGEIPDMYSQCFSPNGTLYNRVVINAARLPTAPERAGASSTVPFGAMLWISIILHLIGVEIYLGLTPRESERLRRVSYERQLEAGFPNPGSAGLTADRFGDAEKYTPK